MSHIVSNESYMVTPQLLKLKNVRIRMPVNSMDALVDFVSVDWLQLIKWKGTVPVAIVRVLESLPDIGRPLSPDGVGRSMVYKRLGTRWWSMARRRPTVHVKLLELRCRRPVEP